MAESQTTNENISAMTFDAIKIGLASLERSENGPEVR